MRKVLIPLTLALSMSVTSVAYANDCAVEVSNAIDGIRTDYINGVSGLASNNFSNRPGTYSSMACLDNFMQGGMDVFFRPPTLDSLLEMVLSFACEQIASVMPGGGGGMGGMNPMNMLSTMSGGLSVPAVGGGSTSVNMADFLNPNPSSVQSSLTSIFGGI